MYIESKMVLDSNQLLKKYLRENSYYYKELNRNRQFINTLYKEMQKKYKLTFNDRLNKVHDNLNMINSFMEILN